MAMDGYNVILALLSLSLKLLWMLAASTGVLPDLWYGYMGN